MSGFFYFKIWIHVVADFHELDIKYDKDIKMCGNVTWAGKSSMEVTMNLHQVRPRLVHKSLNICRSTAKQLSCNYLVVILL